MKIVSVHFPKAGGTSLSTQLQQLLGPELLLDYDHDPLGANAFQTVDRLPAGKRMVHGHFRALRYAQVDDTFQFTFLRHPIENLLSIYFFWQTWPECGNALHSRFLREKPSVEEFARYGPLRRLMSDSYFGDHDMSRFDFIGFHERRQTDIETLSRKIELPLDAEVHVNQTEHGSHARDEIMSDAKTLQKLSDILADDLSFFNRQWTTWN